MKHFWKYLLASIIGCLLAFFVIGLILSGMMAGLASSFMPGKKAAVAVPSGAVLKIDFSSALAEQDDENPMAGIMPFAGGSSESIGILKAVTAVRNAATDPSIKMIYLNPENLAGGLAQVEELRRAVETFRLSGKPVIAYADNYTNGSYWLASASDKVFMNPFGTAMLTGLASNQMFYKDFLDNVGVEVQLLRHGKYKSAGEPYIANTMSDANREMTQSMLNSVWSAMVDDIAESRDLQGAALNGYIDNLELYDAESMLKRGLVDSVAYKDGLESYVCMLAGAKDVAHLKVINLSDYAAAAVKYDLGAKEKVAVIYANGEIKSGSEEEEVTDVNFAKMIRTVRADSSVKAVVFRVNSPGGGVQAAENIRREIELTRAVKPVVASYGTYAASGGYWISAECDPIFTDATTLTGSIGVFGAFPCAKELLNKKVHINNVIVSTNRHGAMGSVFSPLTPDESTYLLTGIEKIYDEFLGVVSRGRDLSTTTVDSLAQGRVWTGTQALANGLADTEGGLYDTVLKAAELAGLTSYRIEEYPVPKDAVTKLTSMFKSGSSDDVSGSRTAASEIRDAVLDPARILTAPNGVYARMEYVYDIR